MISGDMVLKLPVFKGYSFFIFGVLLITFATGFTVGRITSDKWKNTPEKNSVQSAQVPVWINDYIEDPRPGIVCNYELQGQLHAMRHDVYVCPFNACTEYRVREQMKKGK